MESNLANQTSTNRRTHKVGGIRWRMTTLLLLGAIINYLDRTNLSIANPLIAKQFHLGPAAMGVLLSAFLWPYALANLPAGWLVDRFGPRRMFAWASGLWSLVTIGTGFANGFGIFYFMRALLGVAESPFFSTGVKVADRWFPRRERAFATSIFNTGPQVATALAPPLVTALMLPLGWQGMFMVIGVAGLVITVVWLMVYRDPEKHRSLSAQEYAYIRSDDGDQKPESDTGTAPAKGSVSWVSLFKHRSTWAMMVGDFGVIYVFWVYLTWLPGYLESGRHMSILKTGWVASIPFLVGIVGVPLGGLVSDYFIRKGYNPLTARKIPIITGALLAAVSVAPVAYVHSVTLSIVLLSIGFFASSLPTGVIWTLATDVAPKSQVASLGAIQNFGGYLGATMAPIVTGFIVQGTGSFNLVFVVGSVFCVIAAISYGFFLKKPISV